MLDPDKVREVYNLWKNAKALADEAYNELRGLEKELRHIEEELLPEAMCGFTSLGMPDGMTLTVDRKISSVTPLALHRDDVYDWIEDEGDGGLIKNQVTTTIPAGESERAKEIVEQLGDEYDTTLKRWIEPTTLTKHVKTLLEKGAPLPIDKLFIKYKTKVTAS